MENISETASLLAESKTIAQGSKQALSALERDLTNSSLEIIKKQTRLLRLQQLKRELDHFTAICMSSTLSIKQALKQGEFYKVIQLCNSVQSQLHEQDIQKFLALTHIHNSTQQKKREAIVRMKEGLSQLSQSFDATLYESILLGYTTLADANEMINVIHNELIGSVFKQIKVAVKYALGENRTALTLEKLLQLLSPTQFLEAARLMFKNLTNIMYNNHLISRWHEEKGGESAVNTEDPVRVKEFFTEVKRSLLRNRKHVWGRIQQKVAEVLAQSPQVLQVKHSGLAQLLVWLNTFIEIGEDFSGSPSTELKQEVLKKCQGYFTQFNAQCRSSLKELLQSEQ